MTTDRFALIEHGDSAQLWRITNGRAQRAPQVDGAIAVTVRDGAPRSRFPAALLPKGSALGQLVQDSPTDTLPALARLICGGAVADTPHWDGIVLCLLPDTAHWVHVSAGEAISTLTTAAPRLMRLCGADGLPDAQAVADAFSRPEKLVSGLTHANAAQAMGLILGAELAAAKRWWLGQEIWIVGDATASLPAYAAALTAQGAPLRDLTPDACIARGLLALS